MMKDLIIETLLKKEPSRSALSIYSFETETQGREMTVLNTELYLTACVKPPVYILSFLRLPGVLLRKAGQCFLYLKRFKWLKTKEQEIVEEHEVLFQGLWHPPPSSPWGSLLLLQSPRMKAMEILTSFALITYVLVDTPSEIWLHLYLSSDISTGFPVFRN